MIEAVERLFGELTPKQIIRLVESEECRRSLIAFYRAAWPVMDPSPYVDGWHLEAIAEHLEAVTRGEIRNLLINIPPRHSKTAMVSIAWPAWTWIQDRITMPLAGPSASFLCVSYSLEIALDAGIKMRRLVGSEWYQERWGSMVQIGDRDSQNYFETTAGGVRITAGFGGSITGRGSSFRVVDDPHKPLEAESDSTREAVIREYDEMLASRVTDPRTTAEVVIMQRLHERDLSGHIQERGGHVQLVLPAEYDPRRHCVTVLGWEDPRRYEHDDDGYVMLDDESQPIELPDLGEGALLWPERFGPEEIEKFRARGPYSWSGQWQQMPTPRGGGIIKEDWWKRWPPEELLPLVKKKGKVSFPPLEYIVASLDTALETKKRNDFSALTIWGVWRTSGEYEPTLIVTGDQMSVQVPEGGRPQVMLMFAWAKRLELHGPPESRPPGLTDREWDRGELLEDRQKRWGLVEWVIWTCRRFKVDRLLIEETAAGKPVAQELRRLYQGESFAVQMVTPRGDKEARVHQISALFSNGLVWVPEVYEHGSFGYPAWANQAVDQFSSFPMGAHDDIVDSGAQALKFLRESGLITHRGEQDRAAMDSFLYRPKKSALYDS